MSFTIKEWQYHQNRNNLSESDCGGFILVDIMLHDATKYECEWAIFKLNILLRFGDYGEKKWAKNQMERIFLHGKLRGYDRIIKPKPVNNDAVVLDKDLIDFQEGGSNWFPDDEFIQVERLKNDN